MRRIILFRIADLTSSLQLAKLETEKQVIDMHLGLSFQFNNQKIEITESNFCRFYIE